MFIASTYSNNAMCVFEMRLVESEEAAWLYLVKLALSSHRTSKPDLEFFMRFTRVYEVFPDKPPRLVKAKKGQDWLSLVS